MVRLFRARLYPKGEVTFQKIIVITLRVGLNFPDAALRHIFLIYGKVSRNRNSYKSSALYHRIKPSSSRGYLPQNLEEIISGRYLPQLPDVFNNA
jgi:hypothetical protein